MDSSGLYSLSSENVTFAAVSEDAAVEKGMQKMIDHYLHSRANGKVATMSSELQRVDDGETTFVAEINVGEALGNVVASARDIRWKPLVTRTHATVRRGGLSR